eukprot:SAG31_NODE_1142_length_9696_cov_3.874232_7_plen_167_part_00
MLRTLHRRHLMQSISTPSFRAQQLMVHHSQNARPQQPGIWSVRRSTTSTFGPCRFVLVLCCLVALSRTTHIWDTKLPTIFQCFCCPKFESSGAAQCKYDAYTEHLFVVGHRCSGGDLTESHVTHMIYPQLGLDAKLDAAAKELAMVFGVEYVLPVGFPSHALHTQQ